MGRARRKRTAAPWQRRRRRATFGLGLLILVLAPLLFWRLQLRADVNQRFADIRARGLPLTLDALVAWEAHAPDEAAADTAFTAMFRAYHEIDLATFGKLPRLYGTEPRLLEAPFPNELRTALENRVSGNEEMLTRLAEASVFSRYRTVRDLHQDYWGTPQSIERPLEVLFAHACLLAEKGQGDGALDAVMTGIKVARACRATPLIQAFNEAISGEQMILSAVYPVAVRADLSAAKLAEFFTFVQSDAWSEDLQRAAAGSRCVMLQFLGRTNDSADVLNGLVGGQDIEVRRFLQFVDEIPAISNFSMHERARYLEGRGLADSQYNFWWGERPADGLKPVVIGVLQYRRATGTLPESLEALVPAYIAEVPVDLDGKSRARIKHSNSEFLIYGIGPDGRDDGGVDGLDTIIAQFPLGQVP